MQANLEDLPRDLVLLKTRRKIKTSVSNATSLVISLLIVQKTKVDHQSKALARKDIRVKSRRAFWQHGKILTKTQTQMVMRKQI
jgi:hypothetical protein